jgi:Zn-finger nucleic acid-binding protein
MPRCPLCRSALVTIGFGLYPIAICTSCNARWIQDGHQQRAINQVQEPTLFASARSRHGRWALYPSGEEVVVVWPGGALTGPLAEVVGELDRLGGDRHDDLDRGAAWAIRQFLTDPAAADTAPWSSTRARTWSNPAIGYWLSGPTNQPGRHTHPPASRPGAPTSVLAIPLPDAQPTPAQAA